MKDDFIYLGFDGGYPKTIVRFVVICRIVDDHCLNFFT